MNELEALFVLSETPLLGSIKVRLLIKHFGSALNAVNADAKDLAQLPGFGPKILQRWKEWENHSNWKKNFDIAELRNINIIPYTSEYYPKKLLEIPDFPLILYVKGNILPSDQRALAIVGTRQASIYGREMADHFSQELVKLGFTIVSGLARGIDTEAHRGALKKGRTLAVIGSGLENIYPSENKDLATSISQRGALISEFSINTPPDKLNFPQRNRIVAGMTLGTLLIEAPVKSGAMLTMNRALSYQKKLFAIPGRLDNENFGGNHLLIKNGQAHLVENSIDISKHFEQLFDFKTSPTNLKQTILDKDEELLLNQIPCEEINIDEIVNLTKMPVTILNVLLMSLTLKKMIKVYPGKIYKKLHFHGA